MHGRGLNWLGVRCGPGMGARTAWAVVAPGLESGFYLAGPPQAGGAGAEILPNREAEAWMELATSWASSRELAVHATRRTQRVLGLNWTRDWALPGVESLMISR